ncbi:MAG: pre-rRNA-processing protein PNO1 [Halobacteriales archaeon]
MQHVKVPQDRIGVLIGEGGETMREIERRAEVRLDIDSENHSVRIEDVSDGDPVRALKTPDIVRAIGRGFPPEDALRLLENDMMMFETVDIQQAARNKNDLKRQKGRLIGKEGRTRELFEELTGAAVVVYGTTLGVIGMPKQVDVVRSAAEMLLDGAPHGAVYSFLERKRREELKHQGMEYHPYTG